MDRNGIGCLGCHSAYCYPISPCKYCKRAGGKCKLACGSRDKRLPMYIFLYLFICCLLAVQICQLRSSCTSWPSAGCHDGMDGHLGLPRGNVHPIVLLETRSQHISTCLLQVRQYPHMLCPRISASHLTGSQHQHAHVWLSELYCNCWHDSNSSNIKSVHPGLSISEGGRDTSSARLTRVLFGISYRATIGVLEAKI